MVSRTVGRTRIERCRGPTLFAVYECVAMLVALHHSPPHLRGPSVVWISDRPQDLHRPYLPLFSMVLYGSIPFGKTSISPKHMGPY